MTIILTHNDNDATDRLDKLFTRTDLKKVLSNFKRDTNLGSISKMNKQELIKVLHNLRFKLHNIKDGDNIVYTFDLLHYVPDDKIKINKPLKLKEIKPKPSKEIKPKPSKEIEPKPSKEIEPPKKVVKKKKKLKIVSPVLTQREHINKNLSMAGVGRNDSGSSSFVDVTQEQIDTAREEGRISNSRIIADVKKFFRDDKGVYSSSKSITNRKELEHIYTRFLGIFQSNDPIMIQIKKKLYGKNAK